AAPTSLLEVAGATLIDGSADETQLTIQANSTQTVSTSPTYIGRRFGWIRII
ncbi:unnamed protein product, partial [marine sediment metagenome]